MKYATMIVVVLAYLLPTPAHATVVADRLSAIHKMEDDTLARLYEVIPDAKDEVSDAVGYAVFSSDELGVPWEHPGYGHGVAHDNKSQKETYMEMTKAANGLGHTNIVFIFHEPEVFRRFVTTGLDLSGKADATTALAGVQVYQLKDSELLLQPMIQGTQYRIDYTLPHTPEPGEIVGSAAGENTFSQR